MEDAAGSGYRAYMLRLRRTADAHPSWRASLEEVASGERYAFPSLDAMLDWLRDKTDVTRPGEPRSGDEMRGAL